jgi:cytochrome c oxidase cbb3-type subunit I/II
MEPVITTGKEHWHRKLEGRPLRFAVLSLVAVVIGGVVEYVPTAVIKSNIPTIASVKPYSPLEVEGRDLYIREGCNNCHSQMIRPFRSETERYGEYSKVGEFVYDHPFLWGSKRTGPDLHREGGRYPDSWHYLHMREPRSTSPGSIMPAYPWMYDSNIDYSHTEGKIITLRKLGVPYPDGYEAQAVNDAKAQAAKIAANLEASGAKVSPEREIVALIAYLQRLGTDIKAKPPEVKAENKGVTETAQK